jgi:hypothetical protein
MRFFRTDPRAFGIVVVTLVATAIAAPAASARFDLGLQQQRSVLPVSTALRVGVAHAQSTSATNAVQPNPDQQGQPRSGSVPPVLPPARGSDLAATRRAEALQAQALSHSSPRTARYSGAELGAYGNAVHPTGVSTPRIGTPSDGFDWGDAAIGAGIAAAIGLLLTGGTLAIRRRSQLAHQ